MTMNDAIEKMSEDEDAQPVKNGWGGRREGSGRKMLPETARRAVHRARIAGAEALPTLLAHIFKMIRDPTTDKRDRAYMIFEIASRCGMPRSFKVDSDSLSGLMSPDMLRSELREAAREFAADQAKGRVEPIDAEFTLVRPLNGDAPPVVNGELTGTLQ